jgi:hypothetical protein
MQRERHSVPFTRQKRLAPRKNKETKTGKTKTVAASEPTVECHARRPAFLFRIGKAIFAYPSE